MKIKDLVKYIDDFKLYIEVIDDQLTSYGFYNKDEIKQSKHINDNVKKINVQYINGKRLIVVTKI